VLFSIIKLLFIFFNGGLSELSGLEVLQVLRAGFAMDLSTVSIFMVALIALSGGYSLVFKQKALSNFTNTVVGVLVVFYTLLSALDIRMYKYWGFKIDKAFFDYLRQPTEAIASVHWNDVLVYAALVAVCLVLAYWGYQLIASKYSSSPIGYALLLIAPFLILARGGIGNETMNQSSAYHSEKPFANHAALNPIWNFVSSYTIDELDSNRYHFTESKTARALLYKSWSSDSTADFRNYINQNDCKNLVLIVLESFTANAIQSINTEAPNCTPNLNVLGKEGLLFTNHYSSGDRSAESLVTLYTGFPAFTVTDILDDTKRLKHLPNLNLAFKEKGFTSSFSYGGNLGFANMKSLFIEGQTTEIVDINTFPKTAIKTKWGIHDELLLDDFLGRTNNNSAPFAATAFTLSSHEPFVVPAESEFKDPLYNALYYTDSCLGSYMNAVKKSKIWANTIFIITADHGSRNPGNYSVLEKEKFHTPLIICGGPVRRSQRITWPVSQLGIPRLINELFDLGLDLKYGTSLFQTNQSVYYAYRDGAGIITESGNTVYDAASGTIYGNQDSLSINRVKAYLQILAFDMAELSGF